jgi:hypothetical protein
MFDFISHESFPEDEYVSEAVVLCFEKKYRVTYLRKKSKNGGLFWDVISAGVKQHGKSKFLKSFSQDSNFLNDDIKYFLENRSWQKGGQIAQKSDELPF